MWKNVHPVYIAGIQTHDLKNMNLLLKPQDQGSRDTKVALTQIVGNAR